MDTAQEKKIFYDFNHTFRLFNLYFNRHRKKKFHIMVAKGFYEEIPTVSEIWEKMGIDIYKNNIYDDWDMTPCHKQHIEHLLRKQTNKPSSNELFKRKKSSYTPSEFGDIFIYLKNEEHRSVIRNIIEQSAYSIKVIEKMNVSKNLELLLDALQIKKSSMDKRITERSACRNERVVSKIISNKVKKTNTQDIEMIVEEINKIIKERDYNIILQTDFEDCDELEWEKLFSNKEFDNIDFWKCHLICQKDIVYGRFNYNGYDEKLRQKYCRTDDSDLALLYGSLDAKQKVIIYNMIYEFIFLEYKERTKDKKHIAMQKSLKELSNYLLEAILNK